MDDSQSRAILQSGESVVPIWKTAGRKFEFEHKFSHREEREDLLKDREPRKTHSHVDMYNTELYDGAALDGFAKRPVAVVPAAVDPVAVGPPARLSFLTRFMLWSEAPANHSLLARSVRWLESPVEYLRSKQEFKIVDQRQRQE